MDDKALRAYGEQYLMCRDLGHAWAENQAVRERQGGARVITRMLNCTRCNMSRTDVFTNRGEMVQRTYRQPKGYHLDFRPVSADVRRVRYAKLLKAQGARKSA